MMSDMVLLLYYYGEFCQFINFEESNTIPRMGVTVTHQGMTCYWNRKFVDDTPQRHINFIIIHEIFHLLFDHPKRTRRGGYKHEMANVAQDMCINQAIYSDLINTTNHTKDFLELPSEITFDGEDKVWVLMMPKEYKGDHVFEDVYEWLKKEKKEYDNWKNEKKDKNKNKGKGHGQLGMKMPGDGDSDDSENGDGGNKKDENSKKGKEKDKDGNGSGKDDKDDKDDKDNKDGSGKDDKNKDNKGGKGGKGGKDGEPKPNDGKNTSGDGCPVSDYLRDIFDGMDDGVQNWLDSHLPAELTDEFVKETVESVQKYLRSRGLEKANIKATLDKLQKSRKDYLGEIKTAISSIRGYHKEKSISKRNRRSIPGIKGRIKEGYGLVVILDVSGSMGGYFQRALSYIFQNKITIYLIMCDTEVKKQQGNRNYIVIKNKSDFKKVSIVGLGGTILQPAIDYITTEKTLRQMNTLILTDGMTDSLDCSKLKKTLVLTIANKCPITAGNVRQIYVESDLPAEDDF